MRDNELPKYLVVGIASDLEGMTIWRVQRASDLAICAADHGIPLDDNVVHVHRPVVREWLNCAGATAYAEYLDEHGPFPDDLWVHEPMFLEPPPGPHIDPPPGMPCL